MSSFVGTMVKHILGPGHVLEDSNPVPKAFRGTPIAVAGVQHATPTGADNKPTGSQARETPQPR